MPVTTTQRYIADRIRIDDAGCWIWQGTIGKRGYGRAGSHAFAHRASYEVFRGEIPKGLELDHLCRRPACVNPDHLEPVTGAENLRREFEARTHCKNGHELTPENTYSCPSRPTRRRCNTCEQTMHVSAHGTLRRYMKGCRCDECKTTKRDYRRARAALVGWAAA